MITISLNGKPRQLERAATVAALLQVLDINPQRVAVALNGEVVPRDRWAEATIADGDTVEVVRAVGGGSP